MPDREFLQAVKSRAARAAVGASTVRGSPAGTASAARDFLCHCDLTRFIVPLWRFPKVLNRETRALLRALPEKARWGVARKVLNIFLRDCLYTVYLDEAYGLRKLESVLELPLDKYTATGLRAMAPDLPEWTTVKGLTPSLNRVYQRRAAEVAAQRNFARVHLDAMLWSLSRDKRPHGAMTRLKR